jgi:hypothetical protein
LEQPRSNRIQRKPNLLRCHASWFSSLFQKSAADNDSGKGGFQERLAYRPSERVTIADGVDISPLGLGTWAWGNQFLWGYEEDQDEELQQACGASACVVQRDCGVQAAAGWTL